MNEGRLCKSCRVELEMRSPFCPNCGAPRKNKFPRRTLLFVVGAALIASGASAAYYFATDLRFTPSFESIRASCKIFESIKTPVSDATQARDYGTKLTLGLIAAKKVDPTRTAPFSKLATRMSDYGETLEKYAQQKALERLMADPWGLLGSGPTIYQTIIIPEEISQQSSDIKNEAAELCKPYLGD